jgi:hypothetical protein
MDLIFNLTYKQAHAQVGDSVYSEVAREQLWSYLHNQTMQHAHQIKLQLDEDIQISQL